MSDFNSQYFFLRRSKDETLPRVATDIDAGPYLLEPYTPGDKPLMFKNTALEFQLEHGIRPTETPPDFLFEGCDVLVKTTTRNELLAYEIPDLSIYPAVYVDHNDVWHEDYWFLTFLNEFDCWDRERSVYNPEPLSILNVYNVRCFHLNEKLLRETPIENRQLFKMGGALDEMIVVHSSMADLFKGTGATLVPISDYGRLPPNAGYCQ